MGGTRPEADGRGPAFAVGRGGAFDILFQSRVRRVCSRERERACCCRRLEAIIRLTLHLPVWPHILGKRAVLPGYPSLSLSQWHRDEYLGDRLASATRRERHILQSSRCRGTGILTRRSPSSTREVFGTWRRVRGRRSMSLLVLDSKPWRVGGLGSLVDNITTCTYDKWSKQRPLPCLDTRWSWFRLVP